MRNSPSQSSARQRDIRSANEADWPSRQAPFKQEKQEQAKSPSDPASSTLEKSHYYVPSHCKRGNRLCLVCYGLSEVAFGHIVSFIRMWKSFLQGYSTSPGWSKTELFRDDNRCLTPTVEELSRRDLAEPECRTCSMLVKGVLQFQQLFMGGHPTKVEVTANSEDGLRVFVDGLKLEFYKLPGHRSIWKVINSALHVPQDSQSNETYRTISGWINECIKSHTICPSNETSPLPKRLIDVRVGDDPKLYESAGESGRYVALSHRWGMTLIKTTVATFNSRKRHIVWEELPKVFQDAITITRRLGVRYIWIDSLCIIQDDTEDWREQSAKMASIYADSFVTIAATASDSSDSACLSLSNRSTEPIELNFSGVFAREQINHEHMFDSKKSNPAYPLFNRAWCFQERLLAARVLHYTKEEIVFECRTGYRCECDGIWRGSDEAMSGCLKLEYAQILEESRKSGKGDRGLGATLSSSCNKETLVWFRILGDYTTKQMTFERDTLPALSGVADRMPVDLMGNYLAGLWQNDLIYGLLWRSEDGLKCHRHHTYVAPSFSWASRSGPITYPPFTSRYRPSASILEAECELVGLNRTGEVQGGFIQLRGELVSLSFSRSNEQSLDGADGHCYLRKERSEEKVTVMVDTFEDAEISVGTSAYCFSMLQYGRPPKYVALVLMESTDHPGGFVRIGIANEVPGAWFSSVGDHFVTIF